MNVDVTSIITACITGGLALVGVWATNRRNNAELFARLDKQSEIADVRLEARLEKQAAVTDAKIEALAHEVRQHNGFATKIPALEEKAHAANRRLNDIEAMLHRNGGN